MKRRELLSLLCVVLLVDQYCLRTEALIRHTKIYAGESDHRHPAMFHILLEGVQVSVDL